MEPAPSIPNTSPPRTPRARLESWKEIATYLRRDVTTVQRWEKREGLPVHRHQHDRQGTVFAFQDELDAWLNRRQTKPEDLAAPDEPKEIVKTPTRLGRRAVGGLIIAAAVLVAAAAAVVTLNRQVVRGSPQAVQPRFTVFPPPLNTFNHLAVSSDGRALLYSAGPVLHLRRLDAVEPQPIVGTEGAYDPFFSPDGRWFAYFVGNELKKMRVAGGPSQTLAPARRAVGGAWSAIGQIVFASERGATISRVSDTGGDPIVIRRAGERKAWAAVRWPHVLPGGRRFLYFVRSDDMAVQGIYLGDLMRQDGAADRRVVAADSNVFYGAGHLAFVRRGQLFAQPFDEVSGETNGAAFPITERVDQDPYDDGFALFALSGNGVLAYRGGVTPDRQLRWYDRAGRVVGAIDAPGEYRDLAVSRDGRRIAYELMDAALGTRDIWIRDLDRDARLRLTSAPEEDGAPVWSPDGTSLVFGAFRGREIRVLRESAAGGNEESLATLIGFPQDWSPDGRTVVLEVTTPTRGSDLMLFDLASKTLTPYRQSPYMEREAQFSPDGKYMAYSSSESRQREVYVEPIPPDGRRWKISNDYGREPRWRTDGRELFYLGRNDALTAVGVRQTPAGLDFDRPTPLFSVRIRGADVRYHYAVGQDGQRFLVNTVVEDVPGTPINIWVDWLAGVRRGTDD
jgi:eukaryotic-like serine/threonine-protein kinase